MSCILHNMREKKMHTRANLRRAAAAGGEKKKKKKKKIFNLKLLRTAVMPQRKKHY